MRKEIALATAFILFLLAGCLKNEPVNPPEPVLPVPSAKQLDWQKKELLMFVHFGLNSSIYDRNYEHSGKDKKAYSDFYIAQLTELLTQYGKVDELWFDGFGAENMKVDFEFATKD